MAKVLLVEDDNNLREIYQARLMAEGYDIVAAQNGEEALVSAKQNKPDLIISDVMMPRISGFEMLDILRNTDELKNTKVIMLTALGQAEDQTRADNLGADKYLVKSQVTLEDIVNAAKELLGDVADGPAAEATPVPALPPVPVPEPVIPVATVDSPVVPTQQIPPDPFAAAPVDEGAVATEPAVTPASIVPEPDTTAVVTPSPAIPTPPPVNDTPVPPESIAPAVVDDVSPAPPAVAPIEPPAVEPAEPVAAAEPAVAPAPQVAAVEPPTEAAAESSITDAAPQTIESEEAALKAQIEGFASQPAVDPTEAVPTNDTASNDQALANAVEQLNAAPEASQSPEVQANSPAVEAQPTVLPPAPAPLTQVPAPIPDTATQPAHDTLGDSATIAHKKIIQPLSANQPGPSLDELLAKDAAQSIPAPAAPVVNGTAAPARVPAPTQPGQSFDPNSISL